MRNSARHQSLCLCATLILAAILSACSNPCDYTVDSWSSFKEPIEEHGPTDEEIAKMKADAERWSAELKAKDPALWAKHEAEKKLAQEQSIAAHKKYEEGLANGSIPPPRFRKATLTECSLNHSASAAGWLIILFVCLIPVHWASKKLTGRSLASWITGKKPQ